MKKLLKIDSSRCKGCHLCIESCPKHCLSIANQRNDAGYPFVQLVDADSCVGCGTCTLICPEPLALVLETEGTNASNEPVAPISERPSFAEDSEKPAVDPLVVLAEGLTEQAVAELTERVIAELAEPLAEEITAQILASRQAAKTPDATEIQPQNDTRRAFLKGNDAVICAALASVCQAFFGYPITPASEIAHDAMAMLPKSGAMTIQAESEVSAINMLYGAGACGVRAMTATSGPGFSLMQEGISYMAAARLPGVIVNVMRSGPGLGNIAPEQGDYHIATRGGGHGHYRTPVFAPSSVSDMFSMTCKAFDVAFKYRTPVIVLADAFIGQVMETIDLPMSLPPALQDDNHWSARSEFDPNVISSLELDPAKLEAKNDERFAAYHEMERVLAEARITPAPHAKTLVVAFGICSRIARQAQSIAPIFDLFTPVTLWPWPDQMLRKAAAPYTNIVVIECNRGQMIEDVARSLPTSNLHQINHDGGIIPTADEIIQFINKL